MTDQTLLNELQYAGLELPNLGASWPSGLWTVAELTSYLNLRQRRFLSDTGCVLSRANIPVALPATPRQALPTDWIQTRRATWTDGTTYYPLLHSELWYLDYGMASWETVSSPVPLVFMEDVTPTLEVQIAPAPNNSGALELLYVALGTALSNTGVSFTVPDDFVWVIKWGILAEMFGKIGRAQDPLRAQYAESRYAMGVAAVNNLLYGALEAPQ
jgi:hypothetical protein